MRIGRRSTRRLIHWQQRGEVRVSRRFTNVGDRTRDGVGAVRAAPARVLWPKIEMTVEGRSPTGA